LFIYSLNGNVVGKSKQHSYRKKIISKETFEIEEYEEFQVIVDKPTFQHTDRFFQFIKKMFKRTIRFIKRLFVF
jgi:hypothetical protein